jgi:hypothetical protein
MNLLQTQPQNNKDSIRCRMEMDIPYQSFKDLVKTIRKECKEDEERQKLLESKLNENQKQILNEMLKKYPDNDHQTTIINDVFVFNKDKQESEWVVPTCKCAINSKKIGVQLTCPECDRF